MAGRFVSGDFVVLEGEIREAVLQDLVPGGHSAVMLPLTVPRASFSVELLSSRCPRLSSSHWIRALVPADAVVRHFELVPDAVQLAFDQGDGLVLHSGGIAQSGDEMSRPVSLGVVIKVSLLV